MELTAGVSFAGVIVGTVVAFLVGWLWYSPLLFGKRWAHDQGLDLGTAQDMPFAAMGAQFAGLFLMSWFVGVTAVSNALLTVILATVAFTLLAYSGGLFARQTDYVRNVNAGYWIAALVVMIICQGIFRGMGGS